MIVKEIKSTKYTRSLKGLLKYMQDTSNNGEKVDFSKMSNCVSDDIVLAEVEMAITQDKNTRTKLDKTMHLVVSFPVNEIPSRAQLDDIEQNLAESLGLGKHQRISVAHSNTENYHLHIAINKIDPENYKMVNPYGNFRRLSTVRDALEIKHDLQRTTHHVEQQHSSLNMDHHSGQQSLSALCQKSVKIQLEDAIKSAKGWSDIHAVFNDAGLILDKSGRGLVVQDKNNKTTIKASSVSRNLSLNRLEKTLGQFTPAKSVKKEKQKSTEYSKTRDCNSLYQQYQTFSVEREKTKTELLASLKDTVSKQRLLARTDNQIKRQKIKDSFQTPVQKRNIYKRLAENNKKHLDVITTSYAEARKKVYLAHGNMTFQQYLCFAAANGNEEALAKLRTDAQRVIKHQGLSGDGDKRITQFDGIRVDKHGVIAYQVGQHAILDNGKALTCKESSLTADKQLLEMAVAKYGRNLTLNGSEEFKARIHAAAEQLNMDVVLNGCEISGKDPVQQFIDRRNLDRVQNKNILYHERLDKQTGDFSFQGYRNVGQQSVVLLKQGHTLYVKEIPKKELAHYKQLKVGARIEIQSQPKVPARERGVEMG